MAEQKVSPYHVLLGLTVFSFVLTLLTLVPFPWASKKCLLGYQALCSFTPISTVLMVVITGSICVVRKRKFT
ncbi:MAG: hypothetical protein GF398_18150 [Chitinivibrionales bacterium]|nr:hypothetical protein [Chitinivibrionales bacterium]